MCPLAVWWGLRSPNYNNNNNFVIVWTDGNNNNNNANSYSLFILTQENYEWYINWGD